MAVLGGGDWAGVVAGFGQVEQTHWTIVWEQGDWARRSRLSVWEKRLGHGEQGDWARSRQTWPGAGRLGQGEQMDLIMSRSGTGAEETGRLGHGKQED
jgi:hypothetical protein